MTDNLTDYYAMESDLEGVDDCLEQSMGKVPSPVTEEETLDTFDQQINGSKFEVKSGTPLFNLLILRCCQSDRSSN